MEKSGGERKEDQKEAGANNGKRGYGDDIHESNIGAKSSSSMRKTDDLHTEVLQEGGKDENIDEVESDEYDNEDTTYEQDLEFARVITARCRQEYPDLIEELLAIKRKFFVLEPLVVRAFQEPGYVRDECVHQAALFALVKP